ncbi:hypothetical protein LXT12_26400 [Pelomonas sp. P7]|uniref:Cytochrome c domain-containing protein n=1 Tax=Pelomonas caseinilytica TaxID=2906763 RepID=A0ABS8XU65_9BURK|nr:di-heme oxidoredictase family protein [Pelomonas sp. P7]MCE4540765.1 hypothetical protein [Pelomonas sp. P7]
MRKSIRIVAAAVAVVAAVSWAAQPIIGDERAMPFHLDQTAIEAGKVQEGDLIEYGKYLFAARFTKLDGAGRPGSTGSGLPTRRPTINARALLRTSGPDANSCASCHSEPSVGGAGSFAVNVFVGAQEREPILESVSGAFSAERKTSSLFGSGLIELAAREMTQDMHGLRKQAVQEAARTGKRVTLPLLTKGVSFGFIGADPNGTVITEKIEGVDKDLVVRPWSQKGVVTSLRTFTVTALNHHHGIQASERFGIRRTGSRDFDRDGVEDEIMEGDITALAVYQATLPAPRQVVADNPAQASAVARGRAAFSSAGCAACHLQALPLRSSIFNEPGPYNLEGTLRQSEVKRTFQVDLASLAGSHLKRNENGQVLVEAFTDLKRHRIADPETPMFANEVVSQGFAPTDEFLTKRLWEVGSTLGAFGHRGDITTLNDVILAHGGEAKGARLKYGALSSQDRGALIEFLRSMQTPVVPVEIQPNFLSSRLWALADLKGDNTAVASVDGAEQIASRALAAAERAEKTRDRIASLSTRIDYESAKLGNRQRVSVEGDVVAPLPRSILAEIEAELNASPLANHPTRTAIVKSVQRAQQALETAHRAADLALHKAAIANSNGVVLTPTGYIPPDAILLNLRRFRAQGDSTAMYRELAAWSEDLAFRAEQMGQQVATASLRLEALANKNFALLSAGAAK